MAGNSKMAGAVAAAGAQVARTFKHAASSYRTVLSDENIENDIAIDVTASRDPGEGKFKSIVDIAVYSRKAYAEKGTKFPVMLDLPEMPVRWAQTHCLGTPFENKPDELNKRKYTINLQSKFEEDFGQEINRRHRSGPRDKQTYKDINEEIRWVCEQLMTLQRKIARAIFDFEGGIPERERTDFLNSAKVVVAATRRVQNHEVKSSDPDVIDQAFEMFLKQSYIAQNVRVDKELSTPDECPMLDDCMGDICTHEGHVRGKPEYIISCRAPIFKDINYDFKNPGASPKPPKFASDVMDAMWEAANPHLVSSLSPPERRHLMDVFACEKMREKGLACEPVFYRAAQFGTVNMSNKEALERNPPPQLLFRGPHKQVLRFGHTVRLTISISARAFGTKKGVGMRIKFFPMSTLVVAEQKLAYTRDSGDEVITCDAHMDLGQIDYDAYTSSAAPAIANESPQDTGEKRKRESDVTDPPAKKHCSAEAVDPDNGALPHAEEIAE